MNLQRHLLALLQTLEKRKNVDKKTLKQFIKRAKRNKLIKWENFTNHFCCFFLPVHIPSRSIYLVHHIKANDWIPPGGHIDKNELPVDTVKREFCEELSFTLTDEKMMLFDISLKRIENKRNTCKRHYDLWFIVSSKNRHDFNFLKKEFYDARWYNIDKALGKSKFSHINDVYRKIRSFLLSSFV